LCFHAKSGDKSKKYNQVKFASGAILIIYTFVRDIGLKARSVIKSKVIYHEKDMIMRSSGQVLGNKFNNL
jgi:hypothetical protein